MKTIMIKKEMMVANVKWQSVCVSYLILTAPLRMSYHSAVCAGS